MPLSSCISREKKEASPWNFTTMANMLTSMILLLRAASAAAAAVVVHDEWRVYGPSNNMGSYNWQELNLLPTQLHRCDVIPRTMQLCHGIGYEYMRLPNMLHHETAAEAATQISHWDLLKRVNCHSELPIFLCSMYAPVCVKDFPEKEILPCRSLCEDIKRDCYPVMRSYGYEWPEMANCTKFPGPEDPMCIRNIKKTNPVCKACKKKEDITVESLVSNFCIYNLVFKAGIKNVRQITSATGAIDQVIEFKVIRPKAFFKTEGMVQMKRTSLRYGRIRSESTIKCSCTSLDGALNRQEKFLVMGEYNRATAEVEIKFIHKWERAKGSALIKGIRQIRRSLRGKITNICSNTIIPNKIEESKIPQVNRVRGGKGGRNRNNKGGKPNSNPSQLPRHNRKNQKMSSNKQQSISSNNHRNLGIKTKTSVAVTEMRPQKPKSKQRRRQEDRKKKKSQQKSNRKPVNRGGNTSRSSNKSDATKLTQSVE